MSISYQAQVQATSPLRYYRLGDAVGSGSAFDLASSYAGTVGAGVTFGASGYASTLDPNGAAAFNNSSTGSISLPLTGLPTGNSAWTMACWCKPNTATVANRDAHIISMGNPGTGGQAAIIGQGQYGGWKAITWGGDTTAFGASVAGQWYFIVGVWNGTNLTCYVNGVASTSLGLSSRNLTQTKAYIGESWVTTAPGYYWNGSIDEVAIWGSALSATTILSLYNTGIAANTSYATAVIADAPSRYYRLDEASGSTAYDLGSAWASQSLAGGYTRNQTGALVNDTDTAILFNGATGYAATTNGVGLATGNSNWSIEAWVKPTAVSAGYNCIACWGTNSNQAGVEIGVTPSGTSYLGFANGNVVNSSTVLAIGRWYHVAGTYNGTTLTLYLNGVSQGTTNYTTLPIVTAANCAIGTYYTGTSGFYNGAIDEVAIYTTTITATHIVAHYNAGMGIYYQTIINDLPTRYYRLNESAGTVAYDYGSAGINGTYTGSYSLASSTPGLANDTTTSTVFNGGYVTAAPTGLPSGNSTWSLEMWFKSNTIYNGTGQLLGGWGTPATKSEAIFYVNTTGQMVLSTYGNDTGPSNHVPLATWHHLVGTWDGSTLTMYLDGYYSSLLSSGALSLTLSKMVIGADLASTTSEFYGGAIAHFAIYSGALSPAQIARHYAIGSSTYAQTVVTDVPMAYWRLGEPSGVYLVDISGNNNTIVLTGTLTPAAGAPYGDPDTSLSFNGSTSLITNTISGLPNVNTQSYSIEAWVYLNSYRTFTEYATGIYYSSNYPTVIAGFGANDGTYLSQTILGINAYGQPTLSDIKIANITNNLTTPGATPLSLNTWHHLVWTATLTTWNLYVDGVIAYVFPAGRAYFDYVITPANVAFIGGGQPWMATNPVNLANGRIDEVAIYTSVLSPARVLAHYQAGQVPANTTYSATVLADNPRRYYRLNETNGTTTYVDSSTSAQNATGINTSAANEQPGAIVNDNNLALCLNGSNQYVTIPTTGLPTGNPSAFSLEVWARFAANPAAISVLLSYGNSGTSHQAFQLYINTSGQLAASNINFDTTPGLALSAGVYHHCVLTWDGTILKSYLDGAHYGTDLVVTTPALPGTNYATIGASAVASPGSSFKGLLDEASIYTIALTPARILAHYQVGINGPPTYASVVIADQPLIYYRLGDNGGNFIDSSGNQNYGIANGTLTYNQAGALANDTDTAVKFDGGSGYISCTPSTPSSLTGTFTIEGYYKMNAIYGKMWGSRSPNDNSFDLDATITSGVSLSGPYSLHATSGNGTTWNTTVATVGVTNASTPYIHLVVVYADYWVDFWVNGQLVQNFRLIATNNPPVAWDANHHLFIGWNGFTSDSKWSGWLDEVAVYSGVLNPGRIYAHFLASGLQPNVRALGSFAVPGVATPGQIDIGYDVGMTALPILTAPSVSLGLPITYTLGPVTTGALPITYHVRGPITAALPLSYTIVPTNPACSINGATGFPAPEQITYSYPQAQYDLEGRPVEQGYAQMIWHWDVLTQTEMAALMHGYNPKNPQVLVTFIDENLTWLSLQAFMIPPNLGTRDTLLHSNIDVTFTHIQPR